jgi:hypothetical protein
MVPGRRDRVGAMPETQGLNPVLSPVSAPDYSG